MQQMGNLTVKRKSWKRVRDNVKPEIKVGSAPCAPVEDLPSYEEMVVEIPMLYSGLRSVVEETPDGLNSMSNSLDPTLLLVVPQAGVPLKK